ncbi:MAG: cyclic nucleotide-binding domain-containing protein [Gammaproteobacteria bacterium]|nr:cyclic nucleotide-binding domain-containing protein [Gammaproteobacteria bacterium]MCW9005764.1 cyclic nucleotide-binding domain-containing protein [Gammaproteobacteria bacterium]
MALSTKLKKVLFRLSNLYFPFNNLSTERLQEIVNHIRIIELQQDEILQIKGSNSQDFLYLLEGQIDVVCDGSIQSLSDPAETQRSPVLVPNNQSCSIIARENCIICHANRDILDTIIAWDHINKESKESVQHIDIIRNTLVFNRLPIEYIESAFSRMQPKAFKKGDTIQGEQTDAYYLILSGSVEVQRFNSENQQQQTITQLGTGDIFGNEALVSGQNLTETIIMLEDSELLVLGKDDYSELIKRPLVRTIQAKIAQTMLDNGYQLLDVRFPEEHAENRIPGARLIPLGELRQQLKKLNEKQPYIVYCHSGPRSAVATLILTENKFEAHSLEGGIRDWPYEIERHPARPNIVSLNKKFH